jgi:hypothetical protein
MTGTALELGRVAFGAQSWAAAFDQLSAADRERQLPPEDIERLATAAFLTGREEESSVLWARAHQQYLRAAGCASWLAFGLVNRGELARAGGWLRRAAGLLDRGGHDCVQRGYLLMLNGVQALWQGDTETAAAAIEEVSAIAARFGDRDLQTLAGTAHGQLDIMSGERVRRSRPARPGHGRSDVG